MKLPKEHGFWVMMPAALLSGMARADFALTAVLLSVAVAIVSSVAGGMMRRRIRQTDWMQLLASLALAFFVVPAELVAELAPSLIAMHVLAWASLFVGCSLSVRACFARASRKKRKYAPALQFGALAVPIITTLGLFALGDRSSFYVALIGAIGVAGLVVWRPTPKDLKTNGIAMALIVLAALIAQLVYAGLS